MKTKKYENDRKPFVSDAVQGRARLKPGTFKRILTIYLIAVSVPLLAIMGLRWADFHLINSAAMYYLLMAAVAGVLVWLVYGGRKLVKRPGTRKSMTASMTVIAVLLFIYMVVYSTSAISYGGAEYGRIISPDGEHELVIFSAPSIDYARIIAEVKAEHPEYSEDEVSQVVAGQIDAGVTEHYGYYYVAYPVKLGIFYSADVDPQGELLFIAQDSAAQVYSSWIDEDTVRLYVHEPEEFDKGEYTLSVAK